MRLNGNKEGPPGVGKIGGFTLIEVMVALVVLALGMLASIIGIMAALNHSMLNDLRAQAMEIAQEQVEWVENEPFATFDANPGNSYPLTVTRKVRNQSVNYTVSLTHNRYPATGGTHAIYRLTFVVYWNGRDDNQVRQFSYTLPTLVGQD
ncbi:MAG: prepilin-type N-terminal cleavage/methylation domain-containing protein [Syntrophobacteraceae bacterium]|nr:prepilin-type N-terminal cleavage/methylation domain-containing protein [Syntrophobacteraceae bacterium]